jgi:hypothetical protein
LHPSSKLTYKDLTIAIPNLVVSFEMVLFTIGFLFVFRIREYEFKKGATAVHLGHGGYSGGFLGLSAIFQAVNISDVVKAIVGAITGRPRSSVGSTRMYDRRQGVSLI